MGIRGVTTVELSQANGPTLGPRPVQDFQDLYNLSTLSASFPLGTSIPWDYHEVLPSHPATNLVLDSSLEAPSWYEVAWDGISAADDFISLVASAVSGDPIGGGIAGASLYQDVEALLRDTGDKISYKKGNILMAYPHPQYDTVTIRFKADSDDDGMALSIAPNLLPHDPLSEIITFGHTDSINDLHFEATATIDLFKLRAALAGGAFGTPTLPTALVLAFSTREKHGRVTTLQVTHALCLNLRQVQPATTPRTARTTVTYFAGEAAVDQTLLASSDDSQGADVQSVPLALVQKGGAFSVDDHAYDHVLVQMDAHSSRVAMQVDTPENLPITTSADTLPANIPGVEPAVVASTPSVDTDPFGRPYWSQGALARLFFGPEAIPIDSPTTLVFATAFGKPGGVFLTIQHQILVRRMLTVTGIAATGSGGAM